MSKDELPSISDYDVDRDNLPSYKEFIESREEILPSINDFLKEEVAEETQTIENLDGESFLEVTDVVSAPDWSELVRLINDVRKDIPKVPEIKYYDEELEKILENIDEIRNNIPEVVYYDQDISSLKEEIGQVRSEIPQVPEVKYYEGDIEYLHTKINLIKEDISKLPEVKYYDADVESLKSYIDEVKGSIPKFPDWVNQVNEVPDFSWIGKTFSCIDDDFNKVQGHLDLIKEKIQFEVSDLNETIEAKGFEFKVDLKNLEENVKETKERIWKELRETSTRIWDHHYEYKDDDRKLKKQILGEYNKLKQKVQEEVKSYNEENSKYQTDLLVKFKFVEEKVENLDIRYYDEEIEGIQEDVNSVKTDVDSVKEDVTSIFKELENIAQEIKKNQEELKENYLLSEPPNEKQRAGGQSDPLTPTGEKFATFKDLEQHYRLFLNRIQVQLSTIGGGGAGFIKDLDDVSFDQTTGNNKLLIYDQANSKWVGIASTALGGGAVGAAGTWATTSVGIHTTKNVGIATTARSDYALYVKGDQYVDGNITVGGTITYDDVKNVDSIGLITARTGIVVLAGGINVNAGILTVPKIHVGSATTFNEDLVVTGDARVTGILTIGTASITLDPSAKELKGVDNFVVGSATTVSLAPLIGLSGSLNKDYSKIILTSGFTSTLLGTYVRQTTGFRLSGAPAASGSATFYSAPDHYYFVHESDNGKVLIYSVSDGAWKVVYSSGSDFSEGNVVSGLTRVSPVSSPADTVTVSSTAYEGDGRALPTERPGAAYRSFLTDHTSSLGIATASSLDVSGVVTATSFDAQNVKTSSETVTTTTTSETTIVSLSASTYRSVNYQVQVVEGTNYNMTTINVIHDGTTTYMTEYGTINHPTGIATFSTDVSGGSLRLLGYPASTNSTTFRVAFTALQA